MSIHPQTVQFQAELFRPGKTDGDNSWAFILVPKKASETLPRRGRTTVDGSMNGQPFQSTLEPDGQLSHWMRVEQALQNAADAKIGDLVDIEISPAKEEPEPKLPADFQDALAIAPEARSTWDSTTTIARLDWIHWIVSAKQLKTRQKRIRNACDMLAKGKKRVCCFDPSGFYSKAFAAPEPADDHRG